MKDIMLTHSYEIFWDNKNGGKNAINIKLPKSKNRRMDQGARAATQRILFSYDGHQNGVCLRQNHRRDIFPVQVFRKNWKEYFSRVSGQENLVPAAGILHWFRVQYCPRTKVQIYKNLGEDRRERNRTWLDSIDFPPTPGQKWPGFFYAWNRGKRNKEQASS